MKKVAKIVLVDPDNKYLLMHRSDHPTFGIDPDLPGGTVEGEETPLEAVVREVREEIGVGVDKNLIYEIYSGAEYSVHGTHYSLFIAELDARPKITVNWEHSGFEWLGLKAFIQKSSRANDTYMHMVATILKQKRLTI